MAERSEARRPPGVEPWMGDVDPARIGFPFAVDRSRYEKRVGIAYKQTPQGTLELDAYRPVGAAGAAPAPVVVMIHGGSWRRGGRYQMGLTRWAGYLASGGLGVVSIDYRLAPAARYPDPFQDCVDAVDWVVANAGRLGLDAGRVALWGDSAGAHLALLLATSQTRPDFPGPRLASGGERLAAVVAWYGPTDLESLARHERRAGDTSVRDFVGAEPGRDPERWREVSPLHQVHAAVPPTLLLQGTADVLVPASHTETFAERLRAAGAACELHVVEGGVHGFERVDPGERARALIEHSRAFLLRQLAR